MQNKREDLVPLNLNESSRPSAAMSKSKSIMSSRRSRLPLAPAPEMDKDFSDSDRGAEEVDELVSASEV
jgi:hypothetical protein